MKLINDARVKETLQASSPANHTARRNNLSDSIIRQKPHSQANLQVRLFRQFTFQHREGWIKLGPEERSVRSLYVSTGDVSVGNMTS